MKKSIPDPEELHADAAHADHGDERAEHVVGPFADLIDASVAHHALIGLVLKVALATVDLHRVVDDLPEYVGGPDLEHGGFEHVVVGATVDEVSALADGRFHGEGA